MPAGVITAGAALMEPASLLPGDWDLAVRVTRYPLAWGVLTLFLGGALTREGPPGGAPRGDAIPQTAVAVAAALAAAVWLAGEAAFTAVFLIALAE